MDQSPNSQADSVSSVASCEPGRPASLIASPHVTFRNSPVPVAEAGRARESASRLLWLAAIVSFMFAVRYFVPWFAEEVQYSITRGRERAEYEVSSKALAGRPLAELSRACQLVSKRIGPSVVHINVAALSPTTDTNSTFPFPFHGRGDTAGQGSGVIVDSNGHIVTNYHVVRGASEIEVGLSDGRRLKGQLLGFDAGTDLAVLKIDAQDLTAAEWGDSQELEVGALVWAAGSPFGLQRTVTFGIVSAKHRAGLAGTPYQDFVQTDAAVNPGNSGGPLVDELGRVVGINTAIVGEAYQGVSFAVPSHVARDVYERLVQDGRVARGWLGVEMEEVSQVLATQIGLPRAVGVIVSNVVEINGQSPAQKAGILPGDIILSWNGDEVAGPTTLSRLVGQTRVGTTASVVLRRGDHELEVTVAVGERPPLE
jgi:serine protease Do